MQLQMTAPLDIGVELQDQSLSLGQEDVFDLDTVERSGRKLRTAMDEDDEDDDVAPAAGDSDADSDEDEEVLEAELDGMYDAYRQQLADRDAKYRAKEARRKNKERDEAWGGISKADSDDEGDEDAEMSEEGGWDVIQRHKRRLDDVDSDSEADMDSDSESEVTLPEKKRRRKEKELPPAKKKGKLLTKLDIEPKASTSRAAQMWFSNDVFSGVQDDLDALEDDEDVDMEEDDSAGSDAWEDDVSGWHSLLVLLTGSPIGRGF